MKRSPNKVNPDILIFSDEMDIHAQFILKRISPDLYPIVISLHKGDVSTLECSWSDLDNTFESSWHSLRLDRLRSVWWRRPLGLSSTTPLLFERDWHTIGLGFVIGLIENLGERCNIINHPIRQLEAARKVRQLQVAKQLGFRIPKTLISANLQSIKDFVAQCEGRVVVKEHDATSTSDGTIFFVAGEQSMELDCKLRIYQEYIVSDFEHRIIFIDGLVFGGTFDLARLQDIPDIREVEGLAASRAKINASLKRMISHYCLRFGLKFAAFDFRQKGDQLYFLEANVCGEWLYIDECNDWQITEALARSLQKEFVR
jgi:hypothetical protein